MLSLRAEIAACLFAVSLLGLLAGWMMQRARAARRLRRTVSALERRHADAERGAQRDIENLEERLQSLGEELRTLSAENRELRETPRDDASLDAARAESLEMNRRQVEAQERLQRIVREREREIAALRAELAERDPAVGPLAGADAGSNADVAAGGEPATGVAAAAPDGLDATVRIDPALLPMQRPPSGGERLAAAVHPIHSAGAAADEGGAAHDDTLESTMDVAFLDGEEATIALDEETLSLVRGLGRGERKG